VPEVKIKLMLYLLIAALILPGIVAKGTSAYFVDVETSTGNSLTAWVNNGPETGAKFLVADNGKSIDYIYKYDEDGNYVDRFQLPVDNHKPQGVDSVGDYVYVLDNVDLVVYQYNIADGEIITISRELHDCGGNQLSVPGGLAIDNNDMWVVDSGGGKILRYSLSEAFPFNVEPINAIEEIQLVNGNGNPGGLAIEAEYLYVVDSAKDKFYRYPRAGGKATISGELKQVDGDKVGKPSGVMYDGTSLWVVDWSESKIYEYDVASLFSGEGDINAIFQFNLHIDNNKADGL